MIYHNYSYYSYYCAGQLLSGHDFWLSMLIAFSMSLARLSNISKFNLS